MKEFKVIPHEAIGPARLGMTREEIRQTLGKPSHAQSAHEKWGIRFPDKDYFFDNAFQVTYDEELKAEFVEVAATPNYTVTFDGVDIHSSSPEDVLDALRRHSSPDETDGEFPVNLVFRELDLTLYREHSEKDKFEAIGIGIVGSTRSSSPGDSH